MTWLEKTGTALLLALGLAGCGSDGGSTPKVTVSEVEPGLYVASTGSADALVVGRYFAAQDGSRLLALDDAQGRATALYRRSATGAWQAVPAADKDVSLSLLQHHALPVPAVDLAALAGRYAARLPDGTAVAFALSSQGVLSAGSTACKLSGQVSRGSLPGTLALTLASSGCSGLPARSDGVVAVDGERAPAAFRLLADDGRQIVDLLAFAE